MKKFFTLFVFAFFLQYAFALSISPSSASIDNVSNVLTFSVINSDSKDAVVSLDLGDFEKVAVASADSALLAANSSFYFKVGFYDNIFKKGNICAIESQSGSEQFGANIKVCIEVSVNTTGEALPLAESLAGVKSSTYFNSQLNMVNSLLQFYSNKVESLRTEQLFVEYGKASVLLKDLTQRASSIEDAITSKNYTLADTLFGEFFVKVRELNSSLPIVNVLGQNTTDYFVTNEGQRIMDPARVDEISTVLGDAGISDSAQIDFVKNSRDKIEIMRNIQLLAVRDSPSDNVKYQTNVRLFLKNNTANLLGNIILLESIPPQLLQGVSNMTAYYGFNLLRESPPVFELYVGDLEAGVVKEINYKIYDKIDFEKVGLFKLPVVSRQGIRQLQLSESEVIVSEVKNLLELKKVQLVAAEQALEEERQARASYWPYIAGALIVLLVGVGFIVNRILGKIHRDMHSIAEDKFKKE